MINKYDILKIVYDNLKTNIKKHQMNIDIMLDNPRAIHDHTDFMGAIESEIAKIAEYHDKLEVIDTYWPYGNMN